MDLYSGSSLIDTFIYPKSSARAIVCRLGTCRLPNRPQVEIAVEDEGIPLLYDPDDRNYLRPLLRPGRSRPVRGGY